MAVSSQEYRRRKLDEENHYGNCRRDAKCAGQSQRPGIPDDLQERSELRLSDAYETKSGTVDLELKVLVLNINPGYNLSLIHI